MGCNCGGSQKQPVPLERAALNRREETRQRAAAGPPNEPRRGGPGQRGYYWDGPAKKPEA